MAASNKKKSNGKSNTSASSRKSNGGKSATKPATTSSISAAAALTAASPALRTGAAAGPGKQALGIVITRDQVARRAYEIWVSKGRPIGLDEENWRQAERELAQS